MSKIGIFMEFWEFIKTKKKWYLLPIVVILVLLGVLIFFSESSALAPFIYTFF